MAAPPSNKSDPRFRKSGTPGIGQGALEETMRTVTELEAETEALRVRYEQHFLGLVRTPPAEEHARLRGTLMRLKGSAPRSAAVRFRLQALHNRFLSYERMWARTLREREDGTYHRDLARARKRRETLLESKPAVQEEAPGGDTPQTPQRVAPRRPAEGDAPARSGSLSDKQMRALYEAYVGAKQRCNESTKGLTYEGLATKLRGQIPTILEKHNATSVEVKVLIREGKAVLKVVPK